MLTCHCVIAHLTVPAAVAIRGQSAPPPGFAPPSQHLIEAVSKCDIAAVKKALERKDGDLNLALTLVGKLADEKKQIAKLLIDADGKPDVQDSDGLSLLHGPCSVALMQLLMSSRHPPSVHARDRKQNTPLHCQAMFGAWRQCQLLIDAKADVNAINDDGDTPLMYAALRGEKDMVSVLLAAGADLKIPAGADLKIRSC